ncbi:MAG: cytochrome c biogenesis protein CcdA [Cyanobacteria bacterium SIG30]|nr:cytochrome c biogenesis protein CcdA [Cyanobacteria bacterium SIG30]
MFEDFIIMCNNALNCQMALGANGAIILLISFFGGILSSLSPCTLSILPLVVSYVAGYGKKNTLHTFIQMLSFTLGLSFVLSIVGVVSVYLGRVFTALGGDIWVLFIASLILILGLNLLGAIDIYFPQIIKKMPINNKNGLFLFPFIIGAFFALASTPCSTPILISIMGFASLSDNVYYSILLLFAFAMGQGIIIILTGIFASLLVNAKKFVHLSEIIMKIAGIILIICAFLMYYKVFSQFI